MLCTFHISSVPGQIRTPRAPQRGRRCWRLAGALSSHMLACGLLREGGEDRRQLCISQGGPPPLPCHLGRPKRARLARATAAGVQMHAHTCQRQSFVHSSTSWCLSTPAAVPAIAPSLPSCGPGLCLMMPPLRSRVCCFAACPLPPRELASADGGPRHRAEFAQGEVPPPREHARRARRRSHGCRGGR